MNILIYNGSLRMGGAEKILIEILKGLDYSNKNIELLISDDNKKENFFQDEIPEKVTLNFLISNKTIEKTIFYKNRKSCLYHKLKYNYYMYKEQREKIKNLKKYTNGKSYDVVIDFDMGLSKNIDLIDGRKKIAWIHSPIDLWYRKKRRIQMLGERLKKYDVLVTICDEMKENTKKLYPFLKSKIVKVYNPFNIKEILKKAKDSTGIKRDRKKLLEDSFLLSIGRLDNYSKDYLTLLKGYKISVEKGVKDKLYILGDGPERNLIEKWIVDLELENRVILLGKDKNPYIWLKNAKLFLHSSRFEGLPTVLIEALICSIPIISSNCPTGPKEILENGKYGILYNVGDYNELGKNIYNLLENQKQYENYKKLSLERAEIFSKERSLERIEKILKGDLN